MASPVGLSLPGADPRGSCFRCFLDKKRCSFSAPPPAGCDRCTKSGRPCKERDQSVTRKTLVTLKKGGTLEAVPLDVAGETHVFPRPLQLPSLPTSWSPPPLPGFGVPIAGTSTPPVFLGLPLASADHRLPSRAIAFPSCTSTAVEPDSLVFACLSHFWSDYHKLYPIIHRATFEAAFAPNSASPLYGPNPPLALLFAMAATLFMLIQVFIRTGIVGATTGAMLREAAGLVGRLRILDVDGLQPRRRHLIKQHVVQHELNPLATIGRPISELTIAELAFIAQSKLFDGMVFAAYSAVPAPYGAALWQGDAVSFLSSWRSWFSLEGHAFHTVYCLAARRSYTLEHFFLRDGSVQDAGASLLRSPEFLPMLEGGIAYVGLVSSQLKAEPEGRYTHFGNVMPTLRVAGMNLAAITVPRASPSAAETDTSPYVDDLRVILRYLEVVGRQYGVMMRRVADNFRRTLVAAGISAAAPLVVQEEEVDAATEEVAQSGIFPSPADPGSPGRTYAELMTEADRAGRNWSKALQ
ncbi:hypothetical protein DFJ74DRAFT_712549 [Hyaloraphidium curvatum]|nr:hypothetical protein DFJ74DRAFT_712549 [Hyaloraphidium curvatum]